MALDLATSTEASFEVSLDVRRALEGLALATNHGLEAAQGRVYAYALRDLEPRWLMAACLSLAETERFWPKPVDIRERATRLAREHALLTARALPAAGDDEPTYRCWRCRDAPAGWQEPKQCPDVPCGRTKTHAPHTFTVRCPCWLTRNADRLDLSRQAALQKRQQVPDDCENLAALQAGEYRWARPY